MKDLEKKKISPVECVYLKKALRIEVTLSSCGSNEVLMVMWSDLSSV